MNRKRRLEQVEQQLRIQSFAVVEPDKHGMFPATYEGLIAAHRDYWRRWWRQLNESANLRHALSEKREMLTQHGQQVTDSDFARAQFILVTLLSLPNVRRKPQQTAQQAIVQIEADLAETFRWLEAVAFVGEIMCEIYPQNMAVLPYRRRDASDYAAAIIYARLKHLAEFGTAERIDEFGSGVILYGEFGYLARVYLAQHAHTPEPDYDTQQHIIRAQRVAALSAAVWADYRRVIFNDVETAEAAEQALSAALNMPDGALVEPGVLSPA